MGIKIDGGSVRGSKDGSGGGAITTGSGKGTPDSPHIHTTTSVDKSGNVTKSHTTVTVGGKSKDIG
ncbi:MAG: hypothetical protein K9L59_10920 [Desulfobacterales bacterium]|nr:hypothetical protein [Desulfobacterales bacterium]